MKTLKAYHHYTNIVTDGKYVKRRYISEIMPTKDIQVPEDLFKEFEETSVRSNAKP